MFKYLIRWNAPDQIWGKSNKNKALEFHYQAHHNHNHHRRRHLKYCHNQNHRHHHHYYHHKQNHRHHHHNHHNNNYSRLHNHHNHNHRHSWHNNRHHLNNRHDHRRHEHHTHDRDHNQHHYNHRIHAEERERSIDNRERERGRSTAGIDALEEDDRGDGDFNELHQKSGGFLFARNEGREDNQLQRQAQREIEEDKVNILAYLEGTCISPSSSSYSRRCSRPSPAEILRARAGRNNGSTKMEYLQGQSSK